MKILITSHLLGNEPGGTQAWVCAVAKQLLAEGHHVEVRSPDTGYYSSLLESMGIACNSSTRTFDYILVSYFVPDSRFKGVRIWIQHDALAAAPRGGFAGYVAVSEEAASFLPAGLPRAVVVNGVSSEDFCRSRESAAVRTVYSLSQSERLNARLQSICNRNGYAFRCNNKFVNPTLDVRSDLEWADVVIGVGRSAYEAAMYGRPVLIMDDRGYNGLSLADGGFKDVCREALKKNCSGRQFRLELTDSEVECFFKSVKRGDGEKSRKLAIELMDVSVKVNEIVCFAEEVQKDSSRAFWLSYMAERDFSNDQEAHVAKRLANLKPVNLLIVIDGISGFEGVLDTLQSVSNLHENIKVEVHLIGTDIKSLHFDAVAGYHLASSRESYLNELNALALASHYDWLWVLRSGDKVLRPSMLIAVLQLAGTELSAVYSDEICQVEGGHFGGVFRPSFNLDYLLSFPRAMVSHWWLSRGILIRLGGFSLAYPEAYELDFILRLAEEESLSSIGHLSEPLLLTKAPILAESEDERGAITRHLVSRGYLDNQVESIAPGRLKVLYNHNASPLVSIIIPTKNQLHMVRRCVESIFETTEYQNFEVLLVDNDSSDPEALDWLSGLKRMNEPRLRVLQYPETFNFAAINNYACQYARGDFLVLLNNDTVIINRDWLGALLNHALRPEVGVVGAKLLYPNGHIQHAGVVLGLNGPADHPFIGEDMDAPGYMHRLEVDQNYSAVTAACFMVSKEIYSTVGGMDEQLFRVSYNDVDFCLKVMQAGFLNVWTPHAIVLHEGSVSQTNVDSSKDIEKRRRFVAEQDSMYRKWLPVLARDPAYNSNLSLVNPAGFKLADLQIAWRPLDSWRPVPILLAHPADQSGCGQYRVIQPFNALKEKAQIDGTLSLGLMHVADLERYNPDSIILQRQLSNERLEAMRRMKAFSRAYKVYELDDYLPNLPIKSVHRQHMPKDIVRSLRRGLNFVDRFVVSTEALAEAFADFHTDIHIVQNTLDPRWWGSNLPMSERRTADKPRVGWAGGASHTGDLEMIEDVIKALAEEVDWVFFGMCPDKLRPYIHEYHSGVPIAQYPAALARLNLDLAVAPVEQNLFNECKSNLRLLEYGICGYPVVCSDVRCYAGDLPVTRVKNRYKDWVEAIRAHLADMDFMEAMGDGLRAEVKSRWMLEDENLTLWQNAWLPG